MSIPAAATARKAAAAASRLTSWRAALFLLAFLLARAAFSDISRLVPTTEARLAFTSTSCQVLPWSKERCKRPAELMVQRGIDRDEVATGPPIVPEGAGPLALTAGALPLVTCAGKL